LQQTHEFIDELEKELGRKLTDNQVQNAIKRLRKYVNLPDGKSVPHDSHGINYILLLCGAAARRQG
jgi:hypothetical protein